MTAIVDGKPDLALVDIGLPGLDGYEVAAQVRQRSDADVVLVAVSGFGQPEDKRKALEAGFDEHITKPADVTDIENLLARLPPRLARDTHDRAPSSPLGPGGRAVRRLRAGSSTLQRTTSAMRSRLRRRADAARLRYVRRRGRGSTSELVSSLESNLILITDEDGGRGEHAAQAVRRDELRALRANARIISPLLHPGTN